ncbi:putative glucosylceramidase 4 [Cylas formicarius]|uniref:putative glucosylceramidase 4 n=1 Tax=Cylas formicarius TaxID=197179 RepID=UPI0029587D51|nr:putative glucosylceramidase 4 [Cylas formicarius]
MFVSVVAVLVLLNAVRSDPCNPREASFGTVCVCDSSYCDTVPEIENLSSAQYQIYTTSKGQLGFTSKVGPTGSRSSNASNKVSVPDLGKTYQSVLGFGGAFTDSTGYNILSLPEQAQEKLLRSYWGDEGISYSIGRVPISGTDFSLRGYTYCDEKDETLDSWALQPEDFDYKIAFVKKAGELRGRPLTLFATSWSAPIWMKSNNNLIGGGHLKDEYYHLWGEYYLKFFRAYQQQDVTFWGMSTQNEPVYGLTNETINSMGFTQDEMNKWVSEYLGPMLRTSEFSDIKIMLHEDNRGELVYLINSTLNNSDVVKYADGIAVHWYQDSSSPESLLDEARSDEKDLFLLNTESCILRPSELGSWENGERYVNSIITDLYHNSLGFVDWNMVLDLDSGPSWAGSHFDSPVIVNATAGEFYKQPMFYAIGHFSKFIVPGSLRLETDVSVEADVRSIAFLRPDGKVAVVLFNRGEEPVTLDLEISDKQVSVDVEARSLNTVLYSV